MANLDHHDAVATAKKSRRTSALEARKAWDQEIHTIESVVADASALVLQPSSSWQPLPFGPGRGLRADEGWGAGSRVEPQGRLPIPSTTDENVVALLHDFLRRASETHAMSRVAPLSRSSSSHRHADPTIESYLDRLCGSELSYTEAESAAEALIEACIEANSKASFERLAERLPRIVARQNILHVLDALVNLDVRAIPSRLADALMTWLSHVDDMIYISTARCLALCASDGIMRLQRVEEPSEARRRLRDATLEALQGELSKR